MTIFFLFLFFLFSILLINSTSIYAANPIFTATLQTTNTENLDDTYVSEATQNAVSGGSDSSFSFGDNGGDHSNHFIIYNKWNLFGSSNPLQRVTILNSTYSLYIHTIIGTSVDDFFNCSLHYVYSSPIYKLGVTNFYLFFHFYRSFFFRKSIFSCD